MATKKKGYILTPKPKPVLNWKPPGPSKTFNLAGGVKLAKAAPKRSKRA